MVQFECDVCGEEFEQRSRLERHRTTSHPPRAPSAADVVQALAGIDLPQDRAGLVEHAEGRADDDVIQILGELPDRRYRDAAEISRALGEIRRHEAKPAHQPSRRGCREAIESDSAAALAELFRDVDFPVSDDEVRERVRRRGDEELQEWVHDLRGGPYTDMTEIMREIGRRPG